MEGGWEGDRGGMGEKRSYSYIGHLNSEVGRVDIGASKSIDLIKKYFLGDGQVRVLACTSWISSWPSL